MRPPSRTLGLALAAAFALAMVMGPGPGVQLVNPDPADPATTFTTLGVPTVYLWALGWCAVQIAVVLTAFCKLWPPGLD